MRAASDWYGESQASVDDLKNMLGEKGEVERKTIA